MKTPMQLASILTIVITTRTLIGWADLPEKLTITNVIAGIATALKIISNAPKEKLVTKVIKRPFEEHEIWDEPRSSEELFGGSTKIIWGFWNSYPESFPSLCQRAVESWQLHNPDWRVVMMNETNFREYVSTKDLPSTFYSLKVQHQSDLLRLAVLIRYGGIYLDASTVVYKGFDAIWDTVEDDKLLLTSSHHLPDTKLDFFTNYILMTKGKDNPFLLEWHRKIMEYSESENLAVSLDEMRQHSAFRRVHQYLDHPALGVFTLTGPYLSSLWILTDMIWHNDLGLSKHVVQLPKIRWGCVCHSLPYFIDLLQVMPSEEAKDSKHNIEYIDWSPMSLLRKLVKIVPHGFYENPAVIEGVVENVNILKFTSQFKSVVEYGESRVGFNHTLGRIFEWAFDPQKATIQQANLEGAGPPMLLEDVRRASNSSCRL